MYSNTGTLYDYIEGKTWLYRVLFHENHRKILRSSNRSRVLSKAVLNSFYQYIPKTHHEKNVLTDIFRESSFVNNVCINLRYCFD